MTPDTKKEISHIAILGAFIMSLSCTLKITAFHFHMPVVAQWINVVMNFLIVYGCYVLGKIAGLSRTHKLLCWTAMLGYLFYSIILLTIPSTSDQTLSLGVLAFFMLTLVMAVWLLIDLVRKDLKETEELLEQMGKDIKE